MFSKPQVALADKAQADEKAQDTRAYVSPLETGKPCKRRQAF
jgi:hypothetical protein